MGPVGRTITVATVGIAIAAPAAIAADTHAEYVSEVNDLCSDLKRQAKKIPGQVKPSGDAFADQLRDLARFNKLLGKTTRRISAVEPVPDEEAEVERWVSELRRQRRYGDDYIAEVKRGRAKQAKVALKKAARAASENSRRAEDLGLNRCK